MDQMFQNVKKKVLAGAQISAEKLDKAVRSGRLHIDLMNSKRKLKSEFSELGQEAYLTLLEGNESALRNRPGMGSLLEEIEETKKEIEKLEIDLDGLNESSEAGKWEAEK